MNLLLIAIGLIVLTAAPTFSQQKIDSFSLRDQKNVSHKIEFPASQNRVIIVGDMDSVEQARQWGDQLKKTLGKQVDYTAIAALGPIPDWQREFLRGMIKSDRPKLLDWENKVSQKWGYSPKQCLVLLVGKNGEILHRSEGEYTKEKFASWLPSTSNASL
jgi:hypothetical protein